jgi:3-phenylpropionate/trans-cinnamate dioxygenase alpha subunit
MTEQDDMENWNYAAMASSGAIASRRPYNYEMGIGYTTPVEGLPGGVTSDMPASEENARTLYSRWAQFMDAESWKDLMPEA